MVPVGRQFGSPDFNRLMAKDLLDNTTLNQRRDESSNHLAVVLGRSAVDFPGRQLSEALALTG